MAGLDDLMNKMKGEPQPGEAIVKSYLPDSIYHFKHIEETGVYILQCYEGKPVPAFPSKYREGKYKGQEYLILRETGLADMPYSLDFERQRRFLGLSLIQCKDGQFRGFGNTNNYLVLVQLSKDCMLLDVIFYYQRQKRAEEIFKGWLKDIEAML
ncbi:MAG: hypothetical protein J6U56_04495 [Spirochaetia bacterium]|nr:hypothetical protein [Spirochaetia bacterium]